MNEIELNNLIISYLLFTLTICIYAYFSSRNSKNKENIDISIIVIFIITGAMVSTYYIGKEFQITSHDFKYIFGTPDAWIGFVGSIFGGVITMIGVIVTINHQNSIRREESLRKNLPLFAKSQRILSEYDIQNSNIDSIPSILPKTQFINHRIIKVELSNVGKTEAYNVILKLLPHPTLHEKLDDQYVEFSQDDWMLDKIKKEITETKNATAK